MSDPQTTESNTRKTIGRIIALLGFGLQVGGYLILIPWGETLPIIAALWFISGILTASGWSYAERD